MTRLQTWLRALGGKKAFYFILAFFSFEALWIALSSRYPMAFDEQQHFGVIQLHTHTWWPFFKSVPADASQFGAIARDPSFLYHYLMSFPYRLIQIATDSLAAQVIILRTMDIGLVLAGLIIFRRLLLRLGLDGLRANIVLLFFTLIPVFPLMAGQISYDNLIFLSAAAVLYLGVVFIQRFQQTGRIDAGLLTWLLVCCLFSSMVKYAFLPVFAATVLCLAVIVVRNWHATWTSYVAWWKHIGSAQRILLIVSIAVGLSLFAGSYGYNALKYHQLIPRCDKVLSIEACKSYAPWNRDYQSSLTYSGASWSDALPYLHQWFKQMMQETFFEVTSYYDNYHVVIYQTVMPLPLLLDVAWALFAIGLVATLWNIKTIWHTPAHRLILAVLVIYTIALLAENVQGFRRSGVPVAIHGRYLLPIMLPVMAIAVVSTGRLLHAVPRRLRRLVSTPVKSGIVAVLFIVCLQGGLVSFIAASNDSWFWPQSQPAIRINRAARNLITPLLWHA